MDTFMEKEKCNLLMHQNHCSSVYGSTETLLVTNLLNTSCIMKLTKNLNQKIKLFKSIGANKNL